MLAEGPVPAEWAALCDRMGWKAQEPPQEPRPIPQARQGRARHDSAPAPEHRGPPQPPQSARSWLTQGLTHKDEEANEFSPAPAPHPNPESRVPIGHRWQRLVSIIQERRRWSMRGMLLNYTRNGIPKRLDGPARGFGKHLGRWGWREIRSSW